MGAENSNPPPAAVFLEQLAAMINTTHLVAANIKEHTHALGAMIESVDELCGHFQVFDRAMEILGEEGGKPTLARFVEAYNQASDESDEDGEDPDEDPPEPEPVSPSPRTGRIGS